MALDFNIIPGKNCARIKYLNCSTYCDNDTFSADYLIANFNYTRISGLKFTFNATPLTTGEIETYSWSFTSSTGVTASASSESAVFSLNSASTGINIISLTVTDDTGLTSQVTGKIKVTSGGTVTWSVIPNITIGTTSNPLTHFADNSALVTSTINSDDSLNIGDSTILTTLPDTHQYPNASATYNLSYSFTESEDDASLTLTAQLKITETEVDCASLLTLTDLISVTLEVVTPSGEELDSLDIKDLFETNEEFYIDADDLGLEDFSESGVWVFTTIVTKSDGSTYIFNSCKNVVIVCSILCAYSKMLSDRANIDSDCQDCEETSIEQVLTIGMYKDALENAIACNSTAQITNLINILEILISNTDCQCS